MGNSKQSDGNSVPRDPMPVDLNQPLEEKDTIDEIKGKASMCLPHLLIGQPQDEYDLLEIRVEDLKYMIMKKNKAPTSTSQLPQQYTTESL
ncbi:hypothetical protein ACH5RR_012690 [Cinchona calisaya]|uniref:Uncharacterized protein n=1 Tax=Cinchona calisaya TaxID=153742 RepID=A0ABD3A9Y2_9GENT